MKSIKQKYKKRRDKTSFKIIWEHQGQNQINPNKFKTEVEEFVEGFQPDQEVSFINFLYCPFEAIKSNFLKLILCFPAVKQIGFSRCSFSDENFQNLQKLKILKLNCLSSDFFSVIFLK
eukprot:snap_masked-scaffold_37-processed-gene-0.10-mRNA-1 protein AED:1.00 eAED:1.00 QI:0/0/0/0/1/1/5/0/118